MRQVEPHSRRERLERALEIYLKRCYRSRSAARVSELAQFLGVSRQHLTEVFTRELGRPPREVIRERQVQYAQYLLRATPIPTAEIAVAAAFGTQMTFFRVFSALVGMTPDEYRRKATK